MLVCARRKIHGGQTHTFEVHPEFEVIGLKAIIEDATGLAIDEQRILHKGRALRDEDTLQLAGVPLIIPDVRLSRFL